MDPFVIYRILITLVLSGIWIYTLIEGIIFLRVTIGKRKREGTEYKAGETRVARINKRFARVGQKFVVIKALEIFSWRTAKIQAKELSLIVILLVVNTLALYFFYTL